MRKQQKHTHTLCVCGMYVQKAHVKERHTNGMNVSYKEPINRVKWKYVMKRKKQEKKRKKT